MGINLILHLDTSAWAGRGREQVERVREQRTRDRPPPGSGPSGLSWGGGGARWSGKGLLRRGRLTPARLWPPCVHGARATRREWQAEPRTAKLPEQGAKLRGGSGATAPACSLFISIWDNLLETTSTGLTFSESATVWGIAGGRGCRRTGL